MWIVTTQSNLESIYNDDNDNINNNISDLILSSSGNILKGLMTCISNSSNNKDSQLLLEAIYKTQLVKCLVESIKTYSSSLSNHCITSIVHVLSEFVLTSSRFLTQFVDSRGLEVIDNLPNDIFHSNGINYEENENEKKYYNNNEILMSGLQIASHLARNNEKYYDLLLQVFTPAKLVCILQQNNSIIKSKCCNLIGNLCRHSDRFYSLLSTTVVNQQYPSFSSIKTTNVLNLIINCCKDNDSNTRKFACFAVGNASFHSNELYSNLIKSIPLLRSALDDKDDKTRANAAGAIGNLVRNGNDLELIMSKELIPEHLMKAVLVEKEISPQRISLFSLGTMSIYTSCRNNILKNDNPSVNQLLKAVREIAEKGK
jgi:fused-like protein